MRRFFGVVIVAVACGVAGAREADAQDVRGDVAGGYSALSSSTGGLPWAGLPPPGAMMSSAFRNLTSNGSVGESQFTAGIARRFR